MSSPEIAVARLGTDLKLPAALFPGGMATTDSVNSAIQTALQGLTISSISGLSAALSSTGGSVAILTDRTALRVNPVTGIAYPAAPGFCVIWATVNATAAPVHIDLGPVGGPGDMWFNRTT